MGRERSFNEIISQYWGYYVRHFQAGYMVPITPDKFKAEIELEAAHGQPNITGYFYRESPTQIHDMIQDVSEAYARVYKQILALPLPSNPLDEYEAWYKETH